MSRSPNPPPAVVASPAPRLPPAVPAAGLGLGVALYQLVLACALSGQADVSRAYLALYQWDGVHYGNIAVGGYVCPPELTHESHGNVSWFPGYPVSIWLLRAATGWPKEVATLAAAQLACWGFWTYVFLLFQRWRVPAKLAVLGCVLLVSRPAAFFLVAAYSEPLFLMSLLGFLYWSGAESRAAPFLAALHGFVLTAMRISGLPIVVWPILYAWLNAPREAGRRWNAARLLAALAVSAFAALGTSLFFLYCYVRFGYWDLYMKTQFLGWDVRPDYLAFLDGGAYLLGVPIWSEGYFEPGWFSRFSSVFLAPVFAAFLAAEYRWARSAPATGWRERAGFCFAAGMVYYLSVSGTSHLGLVSMSRYALVPEVLLALCLIHMLSRQPLAANPPPTWLRLVLAAWVLLGFAGQVAYTVRFTHGLWVA